jgi:hypothetical protein
MRQRQLQTTSTVGYVLGLGVHITTWVALQQQLRVMLMRGVFGCASSSSRKH